MCDAERMGCPWCCLTTGAVSNSMNRCAFIMATIGASAAQSVPGAHPNVRDILTLRRNM